ncbi:uracil-DNA glycosylase [Azoarcus olearius]|uniref:uracil-DNA glycosylase n=1 Tax=Azoarcus sp. (strain BH72) TaxID=418699 RepID=UPI000806BA05|nr:uracil-DNA glycosylase [Azoarcus olearius]
MSPAASRRQASMLREMGLGPIWRLRSSVAVEDAAAPHEASEPTVAVIPVASPLPQPAADAAVARPPRPVFEVPAAPEPAADPVVASATDRERRQRIATLGWDELEADIRACTACALCQRRKQAVPGVGDREARVMFVGEGPGAEEDQRGEPFVGQAGKLLDNMLAAIGLRRGEGVYIANSVKCRPPLNRTPEAVEIATCLPYLERQIALVQPRLLVALGRPAAQSLLDTEIAITKARGRAFERAGIPVLVTYHPAYLLRNPQDKAKAWEDLCLVRRILAQPEG